MKNSILIIFIFINSFCIAQSRQYNASVIYDSLYTRIHRIECKLYEYAIQGKLRPYRNDSLTSWYTPEKMKMFGEQAKMIKIAENQFAVTDSTYYIEYDPAKDGKGLCTYYNPRTDINNTEQTFVISSIATMYKPMAGNSGIMLPDMPMLFIKYEDLKSVLSTNEIKIIINLSSLLLTDKHFGGYYKDQNNIKTSMDHFYSAGVWSGMKKYAIINQESLKALSDNIYNQTVQWIHEDLLKYKAYYYSDPLLKTNYSYKGLEKLITNPKTVTIYPDPKDLKVKKDTIILVHIDEQSFQSIHLNNAAIGLQLNNAKKNSFYMRRPDFARIAPSWLTAFLFENF